MQALPKELDIIDLMLFASAQPLEPTWEWVQALERLERRLVAEAGLFAEGLPVGVDPRLSEAIDSLAEAHFTLADYARTRIKEAKKLVMGVIPASQGQLPAEQPALRPAALKLLSHPPVPVQFFEFEEEKPTYDNAG